MTYAATSSNTATTAPHSNNAALPSQSPYQQRTAQRDNPTQQLIKQAVDYLLQQLEAGKSETLTAYLAAMARFHSYSFGNIMSIARQRPTATRVAGFHTWKELGRFVKRGEKGIQILAPMVGQRRKRDAQLVATAGTHGQMNYSLLGRDVERDVIPMMKHYGLGLTVWSPLAAGFLSGKYSRENPPNADDRLSSFDVLPTNKEFGFTLLEQMRGIAQKHDASVAQVAIAWLLSKQAVTSVLLGSSKRSQIDNNLQSISLQLTIDELKGLDSATAPAPVYPNWFVDNAIDQPVAQALARKA